MKVIFLLTTLSFLFSGCAAMSVEQCKTANWFNVGEKDGSAGRESRLGSVENYRELIKLAHN